MTTYNTGNPIGSTDARDLYDNAQVLDNFANGTAASYTDRLGVSRRSLAGIDSAADNVLNGIGYAVPVAYASGISLTLTSQTVEYSGVVYAPKSSALPFTTSSWGTDSAKFRAVQVTDADLITYTPSGTGADARTVQIKLLEVLPSPEDFGAVGNGSTDDTAALQALVSAHRQVRLLPGKTYVSAELTLTNDLEVFGYGAALLHKTNAAATGVGLLKMLTDNKLSIHGLRIDGDASNQTATHATYNLVWCAIGSLKLYDCWIGNTKGHAVRTGNIDNFNASYFAHDVVIQNCQIMQGTTSNSSGDCIRIERTRGGVFAGNVVYGGLSGMRSQLYCKDLVFSNNDVSYSWADVGITVAMSENLLITGNTCYNHAKNGVEVDAVVNCTVQGNTFRNNTNAGIWASELGAKAYANESRYWGSIAEGYGTDYSNQTYTSPYVPNINTSFIGNVSINNTFADTFIGCDGDAYVGNYVSNPNTSAAYKCQVYLSGGTINKTKLIASKNIFVPGASDTLAIKMANYQFDALIYDNTIAKYSVPIAEYGALGMLDLNASNRFLTDPNKRSALLSDVVDSTSPTGSAVSATTTGDSTYVFTKVYGSGPKSKILRFVAKVGSGTTTAKIAVNLFNSAGSYVATVYNEVDRTLTSSYQTFDFTIPTSASVGCELRPQLRIPATGVTVYIAEMSIFAPQQ